MTPAPSMHSGSVDADLTEMMSSLLARFRPDTVAPDGEGAFDPELWTSLAELGLSRLTGSIDKGGSGAGLPESAALLSAAAAAAVPAPIAEHDLLAGWLLETVGLPVDDALRTAARINESGTSSSVPWARHCESVVVLRHTEAGWEVADIPSADLQIGPGANVAGEPRDMITVAAGGQGWVAAPAGTAEEFLLRGALARSVQACGAMETIVDLCVLHVTGREQFGRPLAKFQAVQHLVADLAAETALARAATDAAVARASVLGSADEFSGFAVAVAKSCVGHAASTVVRNAHQVHGAIGTTYEHDLHRLTKPVLAWRSEFGSLHEWDEAVTRAALDHPGKEAWALVTDGCPIGPYLGALV